MAEGAIQSTNYQLEIDKLNPAEANHVLKAAKAVQPTLRGKPVLKELVNLIVLAANQKANQAA